MWGRTSLGMVPLALRYRLADACPRCPAVNRPHSVHEERGSLLALYRCRGVAGSGGAGGIPRVWG